MLLKRYTIQVVLLFFLSVVFAACNRKHQQVTRAFYYWKTVYNPGAFEDSTLHRLHCGRMYLRCFDVDWSEEQQQLRPVSIIRLPAQMDTGLQYVPVFFITQRSLAHITKDNTDSLAAHICRLVMQLCSQAHISPPEIQADCDWTGTNKQVYFSLLKALKAQPFFRDKKFSCTIRMHQVKFIARSGVPPVDKGLLMCYNMGDLRKYGDHNSIIDPETAAQYLAHLDKYPLRLDVALPLFEWSLLFRGQQFKGILRDVAPESIKADTDFEQVKNNLYRCKKDISRYGYEFRVQDIVRLESCSYKDVAAIADLVKRSLKLRPENVCLFHDDSLTISRYAPEELEKIYAVFD